MPTSRVHLYYSIDAQSQKDKSTFQWLLLTVEMSPIQAYWSRYTLQQMKSKVIYFALVSVPLLWQLYRDDKSNLVTACPNHQCTLDNWHPAGRSFLNSTRKKVLHRKSVSCLLSVRRPLLGDSFKPRLTLDRTPDATLILLLKARFWPSPCQK